MMLEKHQDYLNLLGIAQKIFIIDQLDIKHTIKRNNKIDIHIDKIYISGNLLNNQD